MQHRANARMTRKVRKGRGTFMGMDVLILNTVGCRSGQPRETPVAWFPDEGGERDGTPDDPRITLIFVEADSVVYQKHDKPRPLVLWEVLKGIVTRTEPDVGEVRHIGGGELADR